MSRTIEVIWHRRYSTVVEVDSDGRHRVNYSDRHPIVIDEVIDPDGDGPELSEDQLESLFMNEGL